MTKVGSAAPASEPARFRALVGALLIALLASTTAQPVLAQQYAAPTSEDYDDVVERLERTRRLVDELEAKEEDLRSDIASGEARRRALEIELEELGAVVSSAEAKLAAAESVLADIQTELDSKSAELQVALQQLQETHDLVQARAARVYMDGPASFFEVLLGASSFSELVGRLQTVLRVFRADESRLYSLREQKERITAEREAIQQLREKAAAQVAVVRQERDALARVRNAVAGRRNAVASQLDAQYANLGDVAERKQDYLAQQRELEAESRRIASFLKGRSGGPASVSKGGMAWPASGPVTSGYGWRTHPIFGTKRFHSGIDIGAPSGSSVVASAPGTVIFAGQKGGYGNAVIVDHGGGVATLYAHLSSISRGVGSAVGGRELVGRVGCTGYCTGPHLHFEVRVNGEPQNPMAWLS